MVVPTFLWRQDHYVACISSSPILIELSTPPFSGLASQNNVTTMAHACYNFPKIGHNNIHILLRAETWLDWRTFVEATRVMIWRHFFPIDCLFDCLIVCLIDGLSVWLSDWLIDW
jgi:hypothetical protein